MSPEQVKGRSVDRRTDVWAYGCVLYEILTGTPAFEAEDVSESLAAVLRADVDWSCLPAALSPTVRVVLTRCLERNPKQRIHDVADVRLALEGAFEVPVPTSEAAGGEGPDSTRHLVIATAVTAIVALALGGFAAWNLRPSPEPARVARFTIDVPPDRRPAFFLESPDVTISPDGRLAAIGVGTGNDDQILLRRLDTLETTVLAAGSPGTPFFPPDSASVGFF